MIKNFTLFFFLFASLTLSAQNINIPDANFKQVLIENTLINKNNDAEISESEASEFTGSIWADYKSIKDLTGIEYFTKTTVLDCYGNQITNLDLSKNTALKTLRCFNNQISDLDVSSNIALTELKCNNNQIETLDLNTNTLLEKVFCYNNQINNLNLGNNKVLVELRCNNNQINTIDVSNNTSLTFFYCENNKLTDLDVSKNINLAKLVCYNNQINDIDLNQNTSLSELFCNNNQIKSLDINKNTALAYLNCSNNQLTSLDVSKNTVLINMTCDDNNISSLDISNNKSLTELNCTGNQIKILDVTTATSLTKLYCGNNKLGTLNFSNNQLATLSCNNNRFSFSSLKSITDNFSKLEYYSGDKIFSPLNEEISFEIDYSAEKEIGDITTLFTWYETTTGVVNNQYVLETNQPGVFKFLKAGIYYCDMTNTSFESLHLRTENITINSTHEFINIPDRNFKKALVEDSEINTDNDDEISKKEAEAFTGTISANSLGISDLTGIENFTNLTRLKCTHNKLRSLNISKNIFLTNLDCSNNELSDLDISHNIKLNELHCNNNQLQILDVSTNTEIERLDCHENQISNLDLSNNIGIQILFIYKNQIKNLNLNNNKIIFYLDCANNQLSNLNLSNNNELLELYCFSNKIKTINLESNTKLQNINCNNNELNALDVSNIEKLIWLQCADNELSNIDLKNNIELSTVDCHNNRLSSIDITYNPFLSHLYCSNNNISSLDLSKSSTITYVSFDYNLFPFSELAKIKVFYPSLIYKSDKRIFSPQEGTYGFEIDYSNQAIINENNTDFEWHLSNDEIADNNSVINNNSGVFQFKKKGKYYCKMTNASFPETEIITEYISILQKDQDITFNNAPKTAKANDVMELNASATSGLEVTFELVSGDASIDGNTITFNQEGTVEIKAVQAGNDEYKPAETAIKITVDIATGISDVLKSSIQVYPNPVVTDLNISFDKNEDRMIYIYDVKGQIRFQQKSYSNSEQLNISDFKSGMYILKIQSESGVVSYKILKK
ncbi:T9SS type A sorting domain-containing protein [Labilibaculum euxinus]